MMSELELHKALIKEIKDRANDKYYDTKLIANAVYWILEQMTDRKDEPQTDCDGCQHYAYKHTADACYECSRSYTDGYEPQTVERAKAEAVAMLLKSKDESQTNCPWK